MAICDGSALMDEAMVDAIANRLTERPSLTEYTATYYNQPNWYDGTSSSSCSTSCSSTSGNYIIQRGDLIAMGDDGSYTRASSISDNILGVATSSATTTQDTAYFLNEGYVTLHEGGQPYTSYRIIDRPQQQPNLNHPMLHDIQVQIEREFLRQGYRIRTRDPDGHLMQRQVSEEYLGNMRTDALPMPGEVQDRLEHLARRQQMEHQQQCIERRMEEAQARAIQQERLRTNPQYRMTWYEEAPDFEPIGMDSIFGDGEELARAQAEMRARELQLQQQMQIRQQEIAQMQQQSERWGIMNHGGYYMGVDQARQARNPEEHRRWAEAEQRAQNPDMSEYTKMVKRREKAEARAQELLGQLIGGSELEVYKRTGKLLVKGAHGDYIIQKEGFIKHLTKDNRVMSICCHLEDKSKMPATDNVIAMKLRLENEEDTVLDMANTHQNQSRKEYETEEGGFPEVACM